MKPLALASSSFAPSRELPYMIVPTPSSGLLQASGYVFEIGLLQRISYTSRACFELTDMYRMQAVLASVSILVTRLRSTLFLVSLHRQTHSLAMGLTWEQDMIALEHHRRPRTSIRYCHTRTRPLLRQSIEKLFYSSEHSPFLILSQGLSPRRKKLALHEDPLAMRDR